MPAVKKKAAPKKKGVRTVPAVIEQQKQEIAPAAHGSTAMASVSPIQQMQQMKAMGVSIEDMKGMMALQKEYEANEALKLFNIALAAFKAENIVIIKDKTVSYQNSDSSETSYTHASLANIVGTATPLLSKHGLSVRWNMDQGEAAGAKGGVKVTCIMTHQAGHSEQTSLFSAPDNSGGKNSIQAISSAVSYLQRYTFTAITGLAAKDVDDDGAGAEPADLVSTDQITVLEDLITEKNADRDNFLKYLKVDQLEFLPASKYEAAMNALKAKK